MQFDLLDHHFEDFFSRLTDESHVFVRHDRRFALQICAYVVTVGEQKAVEILGICDGPWRPYPSPSNRSAKS